MLARVILGATLAVALAACGGASPASEGPGGSSGPAPASGPPAPDQPIDMSAISGAVGSLETHDSWTFTADVVQTGQPDAFERTLSGTERRSPEQAVSATFSQPDEPDQRYIRIGDDIWYDAGVGTFTQTTAQDSPDVVTQYEPFYLDNLAESATEQDYQFDPVGDETVNGIATQHYRLAQAERDRIVSNMLNITADQWAGDVWIAKDGGYLVRLTWGPQTLDTAQIPVGFDYAVTGVDCDCPVSPPS